MTSSDKNQTYTKRALFLSLLWTRLNKHEMLGDVAAILQPGGKAKETCRELYGTPGPYRLKHVFYGKNKGTGKKRE